MHSPRVVPSLRGGGCSFFLKHDPSLNFSLCRREDGSMAHYQLFSRSMVGFNFPLAGFKEAKGPKTTGSPGTTHPGSAWKPRDRDRLGSLAGAARSSQDNASVLKQGSHGTEISRGGDKYAGAPCGVTPYRPTHCALTDLQTISFHCVL